MPLLPPMISQAEEINVPHNKEAAKVSLLSTLYSVSSYFIVCEEECELSPPRSISSHHLTTLQIILTLLCLFLSVAARWQNGDFFVLLLCRWWVTNSFFISYHNGRRPASAHWEKDDRNNIYLFSFCADLLCVHYRMLRNGKDTRRQVHRSSISDTAASMGPARDNPTKSELVIARKIPKKEGKSA